MNDKLNLREDRPIFLLGDIETEFQKLYDHYRKVVYENEHLREENERIKSETYKDKELVKIKEQYEQMNEDYYRGFPITEEEEKRIKEWTRKQMEKNHSNGGAIGGRFVYEFIPTGIGVSGTIRDNLTGDSFNFQELG